jgi:DNA-binding HxlR family transcriptional regulator
MTATRAELGTAECPVARSVDIVGDRWTLLILRDIFDGITRFRAIQRNLGIPKNTLSDRLRLLVDSHVLESRPASDGTQYREYAVTTRGDELFTLLVALRQWGEQNLFGPDEPHSVLLDKRTNRPVRRLALLDEEGREITAGRTHVQKVSVASTKRD